ncbi:hypothetical protein Ddye_008505 [Dipteronia dyeriana]|uniref:RNase H type-1 domain-containing protein n=1 Tax=Dipteronia dyeriana TaxID=168575 RepID=A0AAE0CLY8_9ROSI|nr:hypothetical protein Ddye_008505 [Dipteronia dyeriana]
MFPTRFSFTSFSLITKPNYAILVSMESLGYVVPNGFSLKPIPSSLDLSLSESWWKYLWRIEVPAKVKLLIWCASHDWVPANYSRAKRGVCKGRVGTSSLFVTMWGDILASSSQPLQANFSPEIAVAITTLKGLEFARDSGLLLLHYGVRCQANMVAHHLAKIGLASDVNLFRMEEVHHSVESIVLALWVITQLPV